MSAGSPATVVQPRMVRMNPRGLGDVIRDRWFTYAAGPFTFTVGNENFNTIIPIQSDADFLCVSTTYYNSAELGVSGAGVGTPYQSLVNGGALVQLADGSTNAAMSSQQVPVDSIFGNGRLPHIWEFTHLFRASGNIGINMTGVGAGVDARAAGQVIRLNFHGFKVPKGLLGVPASAITG